MTWALGIESTSYLEWAFLRWVLAPAAHPTMASRVIPQHPVEVDEHRYLVDYCIQGDGIQVAVELDGFQFHSARPAFTYDRMRQNDLAAEGLVVLRFSYDAVRNETVRCVEQLQQLLRQDPSLAEHLVHNPTVEPAEMESDPQFALLPSPAVPLPNERTYFDDIRGHLNLATLRDCQREAFGSLANYYLSGGTKAACVMSVGAGKTALGVAAALGFGRGRVLVVTPGSVIKGTFERAFDAEALGNVLYGLPNGPLIPGSPAPNVLTLDVEDGPIRSISSSKLLSADVIITNFHSLGADDEPDSVLAKLQPGDVDLIIVDEAHIAAADSYQRLFRRYPAARTLLLSACFQRLDGKPIEADVVYRYRLIDSIADRHAKNLRIRRFAPDAQASVYEVTWPDGRIEQVTGRDAVVALLGDDRRLAHVTAKSEVPTRRLMQVVKAALEEQSVALHPVRPRVLFSALGESHAEQLARIARESGIRTEHLHHSMSAGRIRAIRDRYESESGDLDAVVQLKMLGQGYDLPAISLVVPMRPYGSFGEFYQFVGRGIRVLRHPELEGKAAQGEQFVDVVYHAELGLDDHISDIYVENDMDPVEPEDALPIPGDVEPPHGEREGGQQMPGPVTTVLLESGVATDHILHDRERVEAHQTERETDAMMQRYAHYAAETETPVPFEQFVEIVRQTRA